MMDKTVLEKLLNCTLEAAAVIAEEEGRRLGEPEVGARIAETIRAVKAK